MSRVELAIAERVLPSGLTLLAVRNPGVATFAAGVLFDVDMKDEGPGEEGLANLMGDCLDEGTRKRSGMKLAEAIENLGGALEGSSSGGSVMCPVENRAKALALLVEMLAGPAFAEREVERVKREIVTEILGDKEDPRTVASLRFRKDVYGPHPYGRPVRGTERTVARLKRRDLVRFHGRWFRTKGAYFAAAGPEPVEATLDLLERAARPLPRGVVTHAPLPVPPLAQKRRELHLPLKREQVHVFLGHAGIKRTHPDYYSLLAMDHILGTGPGFTSRISRKLRDEMGLCYSVNATITATAGEEPGCFAAYIGTSPEHRTKAIAGLLEEIRRIRDTLPEAHELADVQEYLTGSFVFSLERNSNLVRYAVRCKRFALGLDYLQRYPTLIRAVTREDVQRVAREHLHPDRVTIVSAGGSE